MRRLWTVLAVILAGCVEATRPTVRDPALRRFGDFVIPIDSIQAPDRAINGDSITVYLHPAPLHRCIGWTIIYGGAAGGFSIVPWGVYRRAEDCDGVAAQAIRIRVNYGDTVESVYRIFVQQPAALTAPRSVLGGRDLGDTVLVHEITVAPLMTPASGVEDYWRWRGVQPRPRRSEGDLYEGRSPRGSRFRCTEAEGPIDTPTARRCAEQWVRDNGYTELPPSPDSTLWTPERGEPPAWPATFAVRHSMLTGRAVRTECYGGRCEVWFVYQHPRFVCRHRVVSINRPQGMPELIHISERDQRSDGRHCIPRH